MLFTPLNSKLKRNQSLLPTTLRDFYKKSAKLTEHKIYKIVKKAYFLGF